MVCMNTWQIVRYFRNIGYRSSRILQFNQLVILAQLGPAESLRIISSPLITQRTMRIGHQYGL